MPIEEYKWSADTPQTIKLPIIRRYTYENINHLILVEIDGNVNSPDGFLDIDDDKFYVPCTDDRGTVVGVVDAKYKKLVEKIYYSATGLSKSYLIDDNGVELPNQGGSGYLSFGWTGMYYEGLTGMYHTHYREYDPFHERWLSEDPAGYADGLNLYAAYMGVNGVDPYGLWAWDDGWVEGGLLAFTPAGWFIDPEWKKNQILNAPRNALKAGQSLSLGATNAVWSTVTIGYGNTVDPFNWLEDDYIREGYYPARIGSEVILGLATGGAANYAKGATLLNYAAKGVCLLDVAGNASSMGHGINDVINTGSLSLSNSLQIVGGGLGLTGNFFGAVKGFGKSGAVSNNGASSPARIVSEGYTDSLRGANPNLMRDVSEQLLTNPVGRKSLKQLNEQGTDIVLDFSTPKNSKISGEFDPVTNKVKIFVLNNPNAKSIALTIVHESRHQRTLMQSTGKTFHTQLDEFRAFSREFLFIKGRRPTRGERNAIWKYVGEKYSDLRKGR